MADRETVIKRLRETRKYLEDKEWSDEMASPHITSIIYAIELLKESEQKRGHWISVTDKSPKTTTINMYSFIYSCSECGKAVGHHAEYNYCPGCGAIMTWMVNQNES